MSESSDLLDLADKYLELPLVEIFCGSSVAASESKSVITASTVTSSEALSSVDTTAVECRTGTSGTICYTSANDSAQQQVDTAAQLSISAGSSRISEMKESELRTDGSSFDTTGVEPATVEPKSRMMTSDNVAKNKGLADPQQRLDQCRKRQ